FSAAVRECFCTLYERGLIYQGEYLVNYCPHCQTALSDDEVEYKSVDSFLYFVKYPLAGEDDSLVVATTRPETMFGDTAVAVHPDDDRFKRFVGKKISLPLTDRKIEVIKDSFVELGFGTGAVKITPAHDPHDRDCGIRHNLEVINILNPDGTLNGNVPEKFRGLDCLTARELVVKELEGKGYMLKKEPISHEVGHCYRCGTIIEPYLSKQWFVRMDGMAQKALDALDTGKIVFYPKKWESTYRNWMENIRPWCISRQLWWGHRIPAWTCADCGDVTVARQDPTECPNCHGKNIKQDSDVLDTWFSSWLWPFGTLGWPDKTADFRSFYPTTALVTAYDIIFFWVSRMIMAGLEFTGQVPFKDIYITALVRDKKGRKMSKSLGNGIDPLKVIELYGSDAMKFTLAYQAAQGQDILIDMDSFKFGSKFANKLWNAARFIFMNLEGADHIDIDDMHLNDYDKWILHKLNLAIDKTAQAFAEYKINESMWAVYDFFWNDFCDWYIEFNKSNIQSSDPRVKSKTVSMLLRILDASLKLIHPVMPLITDEIYQKMPNSFGTLASARYAEKVAVNSSEISFRKVESFKDAIRSFRNLKVVLGIEHSVKCEGVLIIDDDRIGEFVSEQKEMAMDFAGLSSLSIEQQRSSSYVYSAGSGFVSGIRKPEDFDPSSRADEVRREIERTQADLQKSNAKLSNEGFMSKAKPEAIEKEQSKKSEFEEKISKLNGILKILQV
ncbi:MAG TPA: valine--tRNA ligase, partial [Spirochaetaceae bacterium]|nr:valine--tRNA ligase [Spirochaetaceae bacterium]